MGSTEHIVLKSGVHVPVMNKEGFVVRDESGENWLVMDTTTNDLLAVPPTKSVLDFFGIREVDDEINSSVSSVEPSEGNKEETENMEIDMESGPSSENRNPWSKENILLLIKLYNKYEKYFKSSTVKNEKIWGYIGKEMKSHTSCQCRNKWKYLKSKYMEKKDSMSSKGSGSKHIRFDYFDEFDDIFAQEPNVTPVSVASSSRGKENIKSIPGLSNPDNDNAVLRGNVQSDKKKKKSMLEKQLDDYMHNQKGKEESNQTRHKEMLDRQDTAIHVLERMAVAFEKFVDNNASGREQQ